MEYTQKAINHLGILKEAQDAIGATEPTKAKWAFLFVWSVAAIVNALLAIASAIETK